MKFRTLCLALLVMLTLVAPFAARSEGGYNDGDMTPTNRAEWWWKFVRELHPHWEDQVRIVDVAVGADIIDARTQDATTAVTFTFQNTSAKPAQYQGSITLRHAIITKEGSVLSSEPLNRALLPTYLKPGEKFTVSGRAFTSAKLRGFTHVLEVDTY